MRQLSLHLNLVTLHILSEYKPSTRTPCQETASCITHNLHSGVPKSSCWTPFLPPSPCQLPACSPALGPGQAAHVDCSDKCALEVAFYQLPASDHRTLGSAAGVSSQDETMTMISDTEAPTDVSVPYSHWSNKSSHSWCSSLGPMVAELRGRSEGTKLFGFLRPHSEGEGPDRITSEGFNQESKDCLAPVCGGVHDWLKRQIFRGPYAHIDSFFHLVKTYLPDYERGQK